MIIETKFDIADDAYLMYQNQVIMGNIMAIYFNSGALDHRDLCELDSESRVRVSRVSLLQRGITYKVQLPDKFIFTHETEIYKTKQDLLNSL